MKRAKKLLAIFWAILPWTVPIVVMWIHLNRDTIGAIAAAIITTIFCWLLRLFFWTTALIFFATMKVLE